MTKAFNFIQNFDVQGGPDFGRENLPKLRDALREAGLDGFLVPHEDEYQNEYLPDCNERLMWVSGFTGSAGAAVVMLEKAAIFIDGRYVLQVKDQVDGSLFSYEKIEDRGQMKWLKGNVENGQRIGFDPRLHSPDALKALKTAVESSGAVLEPLEINPIDMAWTDRPAMPVAPLTVQPEDFAGESHGSKRTRIAKIIADKQADAALITSPASIAWLLNIRGGDVKCSPLPLSTAIIDKSGHVEFYVNPVKLTEDIRRHLGNEVTIGTESDLRDGLNRLSEKTVIVDPAVTSAWYFDTLTAGDAIVKRDNDPVALPKACKNEIEIKGSARAHNRDAVPIIKFLHWLDTEAQSGSEDEISAARKLESLRHETGALIDLSFETISGAGSNGAHCHYRVSEETNLPLKPGSLYLVDSGGQYQDGTTDITRTVPIGEPTNEMRERFTLVLKGHIALAVIRFPEGTTGSNLDVLARQPLWEAGLDYDHGTGHGKSHSNPA